MPSAAIDQSTAEGAPAAFSAHIVDDALVMELSGVWLADHTLPSFTELRSAFEQQPQPHWRFSAAADLQWDSACMTRLFSCARYCADHDITLDTSALPDGMQKLLAVATAVKPQEAQPAAHRTLSQRLSAAYTAIRDHIVELLRFVGELTVALLNLLRGRANIRLRDFFYFVEQCGPQALGIVALISVLVGMILAYLGSVQLRQFGAEVYVANLVTVGMVREMGALMTAVIMAGRTGAAYAAQLGAMQANEEIDAITTLGISPIEYLVLPRFLSLLLVMPLLCIFANVLGLCGGALVATSMDVNSAAFF
ncbi:MAG TPA: ABC transporter permease, partial [Spongiibacteraceae bacterium]|nr:ABC transporter permease [Spongiibacteraceae bacterium]